MIVKVTNPFGSYLVTDPGITEEGALGVCLVGPYEVLDELTDPVRQPLGECGCFRVEVDGTSVEVVG